MTSVPRPTERQPAEREELAIQWQARVLMAIVDQAATWQAGDQSVYDPLLVKVSDAAEVCGRLIADAMAAQLVTVLQYTGESIRAERAADTKGD